MREDQKERALMWFNSHRTWIIENHIKPGGRSFSPSTQYDLNRPGSWKGGHWRWFVNEYQLPLSNISNQ